MYMFHMTKSLVMFENGKVIIIYPELAMQLGNGGLLAIIEVML